jgi:hypothetical protein
MSAETVTSKGETGVDAVRSNAPGASRERTLPTTCKNPSRITDQEDSP